MMNRFFLRAGLTALLIPLSGFGLAPALALQNPTAAAPQQAPPAQAESLDSLKARIAAHISQPRFAAAAWGVKIVSLDTGKVIFERNGEKYFSPASNAKLYTAALALDSLGADYRIRTSLYANAGPDAAGTIKGDLIVYGRGDPAMAARLNEGDYYRALEPLATQLVNAGVRRVQGDLVGDESYFKGAPFGSGWQWDDLQWYYGAEVSSLTVNDNSLDLFVKPAERAGIPCRVSTGPATPLVTLINRTQTVAKGIEPRISVYRPVGENIIYVSGRLPIDHTGYTGYVAVHNPAQLFVNLFKEVLARRGIAVTGRARVIDWKYREVTPINFTRMMELGSIDSLPLKDILREMMKPSQNLYAQLLLLQVGARAQHDSLEASYEMKAASSLAPGQQSAAPDNNMTTEESGVERMKAFLASIGVNKNDVLLEEGSGLSRADIITPNATVALLSFMSRHRQFQAYLDSMPVAGIDGTLRNRMKNTVAAANVRAKTGSLRYVNALSGYVTTASGERLAFSIMLNNFYNPDRTQPSSQRDDIDAIPIMLAGFSGKS